VGDPFRRSQNADSPIKHVHNHAGDVHAIWWVEHRIERVYALRDESTKDGRQPDRQGTVAVRLYNLTTHRGRLLIDLRF
jgi:hypothetical protein